MVVDAVYSVLITYTLLNPRCILKFYYNVCILRRTVGICRCYVHVHCTHIHIMIIYSAEWCSNGYISLSHD